MNARLVLARAVTVATRYLSIRRQFRDRDSVNASGPEMCVLDYPTVQIRVLPLLATTFALHYSGIAMRQLYERTREANALDGDREQLAELHSTSAGLKSLATELAANGIETCRRAMGGHGYGGGTGLVQLNADYLSKPTVEGDNFMITQQVARSLLKKVRAIKSASTAVGATALEESLRRFHSAQTTCVPLRDVADSAALVHAFEHRMCWLAFECYEKREVQGRPWNTLLMDFHKLSRAYSQSMLVSYFYQSLRSSDVASDTSRLVLADLFRLFAIYTMDCEAREFQRSGVVSSNTLDLLPDTIEDLMSSIRPHALRLVDSFALPDYLLDSALGRYDGMVYEDLFHRAHVLNPLNRITFNPNYKVDELVMGSNDGGSILAKL